MPSEQPNENMDKVLKAYAKKRRDDAGQIELDLATRNMLQAEVKRTLGEVPVPAATRPRPRFAFWPQLIIGVASAAALVIAVFVWKLPSHNEINDSAVAVQAEAAKPAPATALSDAPAANGKVQTDELKKDAAPKLAIETQPKVAEKTAEVPSSLNSVVANAAPAAAAPAAPVPPPSAPAIVAPTIVASSAAETTPAQTAAAPVGSIAQSTATPNVSARSIAKSENSFFDRKTDTIQQPPQPQQRIQFSQINNRVQYRLNLNSPPLPKVLTSFGLERTGTNVLVTDADGSVYSGKVYPAQGGQNSSAQSRFAGGAVTGTASTALATADVLPDDSFAFRVTGYNKKLHQKVVFSGNVINGNVTNQQAVAQNQYTRNQQQSSAQNVFLNGRVQVGRTSEFNIQAAPAAATK